MSRCLRRLPQQERSRLRLASILDAGRELLAVEGLNRFTISAVARLAELPPSSVYEYVSSERMLIGAIAERSIGQMTEELKVQMADPASLDQALQLMSQSMLRSAAAYRADLGALRAILFIEADSELAQISIDEIRAYAEVMHEALSSFLPLLELDPTVSLLTMLFGSLVVSAGRLPQPESDMLIEEFDRIVRLVISQPAS